MIRALIQRFASRGIGQGVALENSVPTNPALLPAILATLPERRRLLLEAAQRRAGQIAPLLPHGEASPRFLDADRSRQAEGPMA